MSRFLCLALLLFSNISFAAGDPVPLAKQVNGVWVAEDSANPATTNLSENALRLLQMVHEGSVDLNLTPGDWEPLSTGAKLKDVLAWLRYKKEAKHVLWTVVDPILFETASPKTVEDVLMFLAIKNHAKDLRIDALEARIVALETP